MSKLFEKTILNGMELENRFVRSATWEGMADEKGAVTPRVIDVMVDLAKGGIGLIISGHAFVSREGQAHIGQLGIYDDSLIPGLAQAAKAIHQAGGKVVLQIAHGGAHANPKFSHLPTIGPSRFEKDKNTISTKMDIDDIQRVVKAFSDAALRAKKAGFDGVQIHGAHGYLLSEFLSPYFNKRTDSYGGSLENRSRILHEVLKSIRDSVGKDFPVLIKINSEDYLENGLSVEEMVEVSRSLQEWGIDAIELSGGTPNSGKKMPVRIGKIKPESEAFYKEAANQFKSALTIPLMLVGGIRSFEMAEQLVESGVTDYIALCRPLIGEPGLINRWKSGDRSKSICVSDNLCFRPTLAGEGLYCVTQTRRKDKQKT